MKDFKPGEVLKEVSRAKNNRSPKVQLFCNRCRDCRGHTVEVVYHGQEDVTSVYRDNKRVCTFDSTEFAAIFEAHSKRLENL